MASIPTAGHTESDPLTTAFVADRAIFWGRFTNFVKFGTIAMVVLLLLLLIFVA